jgi:hypothetical protein
MKSKTWTYGALPVLARYWWLPTAFFGPFLLFLNPAWHIDLVTTVLHALRSGIVGLVLACILYVLWKIDCRLHKNLRPNRNEDTIILMLGMLLWLAWFTTCQMILIARDEVSQVDFSSASQL